MNKKYEIIFYEDSNGKSEIFEFIEKLRINSTKNKNNRIQYRQIIFFIELLANNGSVLSSEIAKKLDDEVWELRPGRNRILYFYCDCNKYVLLHHFVKKTQKTPIREIQKAKREIKDYLERKQ